MRIITGRSGVGKTTTILDEISENLKNSNSRNIVIVPELFSHEYERLLAEKTENKGSQKAEVLTFKRVTNRVFCEAGGLAETYLTEAGRLLVAYESVKRTVAGMKLYKDADKKPDIIKEILDILDEFKCYSITPEMILETSEMAEGTLKDKLLDLGQVYAVYNKLTEEVKDPRDELDRLIDRIPISKMFDGANVYFDSFTGFTYQQILVIEELLKKKVSLTFCITLDIDEPDSFTGSFKTLSQLCRIAEKHGEKVIKQNLTDIKIEKPHSLQMLEKYILTNQGFSSTCRDNNTTLYSASNILSECEKAAGYIREKILEGAKYRDFVVASRNFGDYSTAIEMVFNRYDIPIFLSEKADLVSKPVLLLVHSALRTVTGGYRYEDVFTYLKTGLTDVTMDECDRVENYVLMWRISGNMWCKPWTMNTDGFSGMMSDEEREKLAILNQIREKIITPLEHLKQAFSDAEIGRDYVSALYDFLVEIGADILAAKCAEEHQNNGRLKTADEYRQLWEILITAMEQFAFIQGDSNMDARLFCDLFDMVLSQYDIGSIPVSMDRVTCGAIERVCNSGVKHLILLGVNDGVLPKAQPSQGVLTDDDRELLVGLGIELSSLGNEKMLMEQEIIYRAFSCPSQSILVSWHSFSSDGASVRPSFLVKEIETLLSGIKRTSEKDDGNIYRLMAEKPCFDYACAYIGGQKNEITKAAYEFYSTTEQFEKVLNSNIDRVCISDKDVIQTLYGENITLTASRVDKFYTCKFGFFMEYGLCAKARRTASFDAPEVGTFIHYILENTIDEGNKREGGIKALTIDEAKKISKKYTLTYIETILGGLENKNARFRYLFRRLVKMTENIVENVIEELQRSDFVPIDFELDFSRGGEMPPIEIDIADNTKAQIIGKVDRVDGYISEDKLYVRVMDYKSGSKAFSLSDIWSGLNMQLLIYLFALQKTGLEHYRKKIAQSINEITPAGALYIPTKEAVIQTERNADDATITKLRDKALKRSGIILNSMSVIEAMENGVDKGERFIPIKIKKDGAISAQSVVASVAQMGKLSTHIAKKLKEMGEEILRGNVETDPYYRNKTSNACDWCKYKCACHFDEKCSKRKYLVNMNKEEFWKAVGGDEDEQ